MQSETEGTDRVTRIEEFLFSCLFRSLLILIIKNIIPTLRLRTLRDREIKLFDPDSKYGWSSDLDRLTQGSGLKAD